MILFPVVLITFLNAHQTFSLSCCDSTLYPYEKLTGDENVASGCPRIAQKTHARDPKMRNKGFSGNKCDFCTIEVFFKNDDGTKLYLQSCGSFKAAEFEYYDANIRTKEEMKRKDGIDRMAMVDNHKWTKQYSDFGVDLATLDQEKTKRACKIREHRSGYNLIEETNNAGIDEPSLSVAKPFSGILPANETGDFTFTNVAAKYKKPLKYYKSVLCACFDDKCNGEKEIMPTKDDLKKEHVHWKYIQGE